MIRSCHILGWLPRSSLLFCAVLRRAQWSKIEGRSGSLRVKSTNPVAKQQRLRKKDLSPWAKDGNESGIGLSHGAQCTHKLGLCPWSVSGTRCVCTFFRKEKTLLNDFEKREVFNLMSLLPLASKWVDRLYVLTLPLAL